MSDLRRRLLALEAPEEFADDGLRYADHGFVRDDAREARERIAADLLFKKHDSDDAAWFIYEHALRMIAELEGMESLDFLIEELEGALAAEDAGFPEIFHDLAVSMGPPAAPVLLEHFRSDETSGALRFELVRTLGGFLEADVARDEIIAAFEETLRGDPDERAIKAFVIAEAIDQDLTELVPATRTAFEANLVDVSICGDLEEVEIAFGLRGRRSKPRRNLVELEAELAVQSRLERLGPIPLDAEDAAVIAHALRLYGSPTGIRDATELDAYLMTVIVAPHLVEPSAWIPSVWDSHGGSTGPRWPDSETVERVMKAFMTRYNEILDAVIDQSFPPPFGDIEVDGPAFRSWIAGFIKGFAHWGYDYDDLGPRHQKLFDLLVGSEDDEPDEVDFHRWLAAAKAAYDARRPGPPPARDTPEWWDTEPVDTIRREEPKVGRNDPCPCGSGKKFKSCCME